MQTSHLQTKIGEYAIIFNSKKQFLLLQFGKNHNYTWHFPGGRLNHGEQSVEALYREVKEETNLEIHDVKAVFTKMLYGESPKYAVFFTAKVKEPYTVKISDEHQSYHWYSKKDLDSIDFKHDFYKDLLLRVC